MSRKRGFFLRTGGFSLTELMVVLAIAGVMLLVGVPSMQNLILDARLSARTDQFMGMLSEARMTAIKQGSGLGANIVKICPAANPDTATACSTTASDWSKGVVILNGTTVVRRLVFSEGVTITSTVIEIAFTRTLGSSTAATITLCAAGRKQQAIQVTASGRIAKKINSSVTCS